MRILGIDPGLAACGVAVVRDGKLTALDVLTTVKRRGESIYDRLCDLQAELAPYLAGVDEIAIETPSFPRSARATAQLWAVFGVAMGMGYHRAAFFDWRAASVRQRLGLPTFANLDDPKLARKERKRTTAELMLSRWPDAAKLLPKRKGLHEHALDALALATAHLARMLEEPEAFA